MCSTRYAAIHRHNYMDMKYELLSDRFHSGHVSLDRKKLQPRFPHAGAGSGELRCRSSQHGKLTLTYSITHLQHSALQNNAAFLLIPFSACLYHL